MARVHHIHVHLHDGAFEENKHPREGGKFSSTGGGSAGSSKPSTASKFAAKHNPAAGRRESSEPKPSAEQEKYLKEKEAGSGAAFL